MSRKHENFTYTGYKYAPESYHFYLNGKILNLDIQTRHGLGYLVSCNKSKKAKDELKRILRKSEKENKIKYKCVAFFFKESNEYIFSEDFAFNPGDKKMALHCYKKWKQYIKKRNGRMQIIEVRQGFVTPFGDSEDKKIDTQQEIDLTKGIIVKLVESEKDKLIAM